MAAAHPHAGGHHGHEDDNDEVDDPSDALYWIVRVVPPVVIIILIVLLMYVIWRFCIRKGTTDDRERNGRDFPLGRFPPSSSLYEKVSLAPSTISSSGSEGYGSLQSQPLLLGRHASSIHEIVAVEDIQYLEPTGGDSPPGELGQIVVTIGHTKSSGLLVSIHEVMNLRPRPFSATLDPYVRMRVMSVERGTNEDYDFHYQTVVKRKTQNPVYEETVRIRLPEEKLPRYSIEFVVVNHHRFSQKDVIGQVEVPLFNFSTNDEVTRSYDLLPPRKKTCGEISLSLCYLPTSNRLLVGVLQASKLACPGEARTIDPCVRVSLIQGGRKFRRKKTRVKEADINPVFNERFFFEVPVEKLDRVQLLVVVTNEAESGQGAATGDSDTDGGYADHEVGQVMIGFRSSTRAHAHWLKMLESPRETFAQWYTLTA